MHFAIFNKPNDETKMIIFIQKKWSVVLIDTMIVWLSGNSGAGKTFTGDYLARCAEFTHIDGDELFWATTPAEKGLFSNLVKAFDHWFEGASAPVELWHPYFHVVLSRVRAAATTSARVCISLTVYHRETRDFLREHLPEHIFVLLRVSAPELLRRARVRFAEYAKSRGQLFERAFEEAHGLPAGSFTDADFQARTRAIMRGLQPLAPDEARCHELDADDGAPWAPLHALLGLSDEETLLGHPAVGASWEGFVLENLITAAGPNASAHFYRTSAGAEIDLLLHWPDGENWAIEAKRSLSPKVERGFHIACEDLKPSRQLVVYPGSDSFPLGPATQAVPLGELCRQLAQG
jgi:gluconate kinase